MSDCGYLANDPRAPIAERLRAWRLGHRRLMGRAAQMLCVDRDWLQRVEDGELLPDDAHLELLGQRMDAWPVPNVKACAAASLAARPPGSALTAGPGGGAECEAAPPPFRSSSAAGGPDQPLDKAQDRPSRPTAPAAGVGGWPAAGAHQDCSPCPDCRLVVGGRVERAGVALVRRGAEHLVQLQLIGAAGGAQIYEMPAAAAQALAGDLHIHLAVHANPEIFEEEEGR